MNHRSHGQAEYERLLRAKLDPKVVRFNLALAGLVAATHECAKVQVIGSIRDFLVLPGGSDERYRSARC